MIYKAFPYDSLKGADLVLDATYTGGHQPHAGADPINVLLPVGNQGGFRFGGSPNIGKCKLAVLYTSGDVADWPDYIDQETGKFVYFGDNRVPGRKLHETPKGGNEFLRQLFDAYHSQPQRRDLIPPIFVFEKGLRGRDVVFRGLAVPGSSDSTSLDDLVAVWKTTQGHRFQNYRAIFTILDSESVSREWINAVVEGAPLSSGCPESWLQWVKTGRYRPLQAERTTVVRTRGDQLPNTEEGLRIIKCTHSYFKASPHDFEKCAATLWKMSSPATTSIDVTRPSRDGGRDALGRYALGPESDRIHIDFALEAKCYEMKHGVGVQETSRLISRLRHRQFGVFVTTSYVSEQAYTELREDQHPVVILAARDIVEILRRNQQGSATGVERWLHQEFPLVNA